MMLPIALSILAELGLRQGAANFRATPYAAGLMLITAFAASVGGMATPVGTPPNLIGIGAVERLLGYKITFFEWMRLGLPVAAVLTVFLVWRFRRHCPFPNLPWPKTASCWKKSGRNSAPGPGANGMSWACSSAPSHSGCFPG